MDPHEDVLLPNDIALHQSDVFFVLDRAGVADDLEVPVPGGKRRGRHPLDQVFVALTVGDEIGDTGNRELVLLGERLELREASHRPVVVQDLADHRGWFKTGEPRYVDRSFGMAGTPQYTPFLRDEREDVPWSSKVLRESPFVDYHLNGMRTIVGRDSGRDPRSSIDGDREVGLVQGRVLRDHRSEGELLCPRRLDRHADQATAVTGHEVDRLRGDVLRRHDEIPFVLPVFVIDQDHHLTGTDPLDRLFYLNQHV